MNSAYHPRMFNGGKMRWSCQYLPQDNQKGSSRRLSHYFKCPISSLCTSILPLFVSHQLWTGRRWAPWKADSFLLLLTPTLGWAECISGAVCVSVCSHKRSLYWFLSSWCKHWASWNSANDSSACNIAYNLAYTISNSSPNFHMPKITICILGCFRECTTLL